MFATINKKMQELVSKFVKDNTVKLYLVDVIDVKLAERDARVMAAERAAQREKLKEIIAQKQDNALQNLSLEDLQQQLAALS